ncbi:MAG: hypothetical protein H6Q05_1973 [Acidobacteria bacterium]|nr:hypothetical protein [Acidobacteriota bacterium]
MKYSKCLIGAAAILVIFSMSACVPLLSLYPLWDKAHAVDMPGLAGTWIMPDENEKVIIQDAEDIGYLVEYIAREKSKTVSSSYRMHAVKLGKTFFFDFEPEERGLRQWSEAEAFLPIVRAHFVVRAELTGDTLKLGILDDERFVKKVRKEGIQIPYAELHGDEYVLTAETAAIQNFLLQYGDDPALWEMNEFQRLR